MYKPSYVWPNPAFPFRIYFEHKNLRIFIIENIQHNWNWLSKYHNKIRDSDYFFVYCGWYHSDFFAKEAEAIFCDLNLNKKQFFFMFNALNEMDNFSKYGFCGDVINQNCWLDERGVMSPKSLEKKYDAIYVGRLSPFKRHYLAGRVKNLALVAGSDHGNKSEDELPAFVYRNDEPLSPSDVCVKINQSNCGLILSAEEGACFASSEYLLCGVPVVSTQELGGRSVWYDEYNSAICEDNKDSIANAVEFFRDNPRDPIEIRESHIARANKYRAKFVLKLACLFEEHRVHSVDPFVLFKDNFIHKLRKSCKPKFDEIFK